MRSHPECPLLAENRTHLSSRNAAGGKATPRCEAFIAGKPLQDLGVALPQAGQSELVLAPSAVAYTTEEVLLEAGDKENGCKVLSLPQGQPGFRIPFGKTFRRIQSKRSTAAAKVLEAMLAMEERTRATKPLASARCTRNTAISRTPRPTFAARMSNLLSTLGSMSLGQSRVRERSCFSYSTRQYSIFESTAARKAEADTVALKSLMTFLPQFVRQRCLDGMALSDLSENRTVSVLFVVADLQVLVGRPLVGPESFIRREEPSLTHLLFPPLQGSSLTLEKIKVLQELLGKAVDVADGKCGGTTRQARMLIGSLGFVAVSPGVVVAPAPPRCPPR